MSRHRIPSSERYLTPFDCPTDMHCNMDVLFLTRCPRVESTRKNPILSSESDATDIGERLERVRGNEHAKGMQALSK